MRLEIHPWRTPLHAGRTGRRGPPDAHRPHREVEIAGNNYRTGHWLLATGDWLLATGYWRLVTGDWLLATGNRLLSSQHPTRRCVRKLPVEPYWHAIHEHIADAFGELLRFRIRRRIPHGDRIEHDHVRERSGTKHAAIGDLEYRRRQARHRVNGEFERHNLPLAHVDREPPRERAVVARMRESHARHRQSTVARGHGEGRLHDRFDVGLRHVERHDRRIARGHHLDRRFHRRHAFHLRDLGQRLARERSVRGVRRDQHRVRTVATPQVLRHHRVGDLDAARRERRTQRRRRRFVWILIRKHLDTARACVLDVLDQRRAEAPTVPPECFHVTDDADGAGFLGNADHFTHRGADAGVVIPLVANVTGVDAAERRRDLRQLD